MDTVVATCPSCQATREYGAEWIGRYPRCLACGTPFYVEVPTLAAAQGEQGITGPRLAGAAKPDTKLDDLLLDTRKGTQFILQSIRDLETDAKITRRLIIAILVLALANLAGIVFLLLRP